MLHRHLSLNPGPSSASLFTVLWDQPYRTYYVQAIFRVSFTGSVSTSVRPFSFSLHSFRRVGATFAFDCHIPSEIIKLQGDWQSDAYLVYLELSLQQKQHVFHAMASKLRSIVTCRIRQQFSRQTHVYILFIHPDAPTHERSWLFQLRYSFATRRQVTTRIMSCSRSVTPCFWCNFYQLYESSSLESFSLFLTSYVLSQPTLPFSPVWHFAILGLLSSNWFSFVVLFNKLILPELSCCSVTWVD